MSIFPVLASNSKRSIALLFFATACTSTQTGDAVAEPVAGQKKRQSHEFKIAPPSGASDTLQRQQREKLEQVLAGESGTDGISEIKLPASVMGLKEGDVTGDPIATSREQARMQRTDAEIAASSGLSEDANRPMTPSFTAQTQKIRELFRGKRFEDALVETNELVLYYPRSALLWTMKGTLHLRLQQNDLSLSAYEKAFDIEPSQRLLAQIEDLRRVVSEREGLRRQKNNPDPGNAITRPTVGGQK